MIYTPFAAEETSPRPNRASARTVLNAPALPASRVTKRGVRRNGADLRAPARAVNGVY